MSMSEEQKKVLGDKIVEIIRDLEVKDALDVIGGAFNAVSKEGQKEGNLNKMQFCMIPMYYIAKLVSECHGRDGIVHIKDDGSVSFTIQAGNVKNEIVK